ncbi:tetratricopeptide repeat protein [Pirellulaceae bacterium SH449]
MFSVRNKPTSTVSNAFGSKCSEPISLRRIAIGLSLQLICLTGLACTHQPEIEPTDDTQSVRESSVDSLLGKLSDSRYTVRREAFLRLCDAGFDIDSFLEKETESSDFHRSRVAAWLLKLRLSPGDISQKFEMLSDYQAMIGGDYTPLLQRIVAGRWAEALDLLRTIPQESLKDLLERDARQNLTEGRFVRSIIEQAWRSGNEWAVPQIVDIFAPNENRVGINLWWREIGMPEEWKVSEPDDPKVTAMQLASQGKVQEALDLAAQNRLRAEFDRIALESENWDAWLRGMNQNSLVPPSGAQSKIRHWALAVAKNDQEKALSLWNEIKTPKGSFPNRGHATLALVMNDMPYFEQVVDTLPKRDAFDVLFSAGRVKDAFRKVGLDELTPEALDEWLKSIRVLFDDLEQYSVYGPARDLLSMYVIAFHQMGKPELEERFDKYWMSMVNARLAGDGPDAMYPMISRWVRVNQRDKAIKYLKEYSKKNANSVAIWLNTSAPAMDISDKRSDYIKCLEKVFEGSIVEPMLILQYLVKQQQSGTPAARITKAIEVLNDLHFGRKPSHWDGVAELKALKTSIQVESYSEAEFYKSIAVLYDLFGDTKEAVQVFRDYVLQSQALTDPDVWVMSDLLVKLGYAKTAADLMFRRSEVSDNLGTFVRTVDLLDRTGKYAELERLQYRRLSSTSPQINVPYSLFTDDAELCNRAEVELMLDRLDRVSGVPVDKVGESTQRQDLLLRYQIAKNDLSRAYKAKRAAMRRLMMRAPDFLVMDDYTSRGDWQLIIGPFALDAVQRKDSAAVGYWLEIAARVEPSQIQYPIDVIPHADKHFDKETVDAWFDLFWSGMQAQLADFPDDAMTLNNTAWMASQCNRRLDEAVVLSRRAVELRPDPTYIDTLADLEFQLGNVERAIELSQKCRELEPREEQHKKQLKRFFGAASGGSSGS